MILKQLKPRKALNKAYLKLKPDRQKIDVFKANLIQLLDRIDDSETEEYHKNLISDFLKRTYYQGKHYINTKERADLVIHNDKNRASTVGVIVETKRPTNKWEMITTKEINAKAFHELLLYYLRERITNNNVEMRHLIITNIYEWYIFDANVFERNFAQNKQLIKEFEEFEKGTLSGTKTNFFYSQIAHPFIDSLTNEIEYAYFDIRAYEKPLRNNNPDDDNKLIALYKLLSAEHLLKLPFANDSNTLDKGFYGELLHIMGLSESKEGGKKVIGREAEGKRNIGSLIENAVNELDSLDKMSRLERPSQYGNTVQERLFNVALELSITWMNRILFMKLLEAQLIKYHKGDTQYEFLNSDKIQSYDDLNSLFFKVLARKLEDRGVTTKEFFDRVPYLNSSLFEPTELEHTTLFVSNLGDSRLLPIYSATVLKDSNGKRRTGKMNPLQYMFEFLDAYDFTSEGAEAIQEDNKTLINASVLGLIFEKINGYKDGSFFTPGFITMYMCRETIRKAVLQKFNEAKQWHCKDMTQLYNRIDDIDEANQIVNSLKICDPAVGSGHFLVSALNEIIAIKNDLRILSDRQGRRLKEYHVVVENDELIVTDEEGAIFEYNPTSRESQRVQEALFHEKQTIIENCLFGVDINPNSVKICRLRLWIELLKNAYYKNETELETLPNIDINIKCGNSLVSRFALDANLGQALKKSKWTIDSYRSAVATYRNAHSREEKRQMEQLMASIKSDFRSEIADNDPKVKRLAKIKGELLFLTTQTSLFEQSKKEKKEWNTKVDKFSKEIKKLETEIDEIKANKIYENAFEWRFEFPEVLNDEGDFVGFDVVIGNPPYMIVFETVLKKYLETSYHEFKRNNDLYIAFVIRAFSLLKTNGIYSFITPNTFIKGNYFKGIREFLANKTQIIEIIDFGSEIIFEEVSVFSSITTALKSKPLKDWILKTSFKEIKGTIKSEQVDFVFKNKLISRLDKLTKFDEFFLINDIGFNYWTKGRGKVRGGSIGSRVFYNGEKQNQNDIPFIRGADIEKYSISFSNNYLRHNWQFILEENDTFRFNQEIMETSPKIIYRQTSNRIVATIDYNKNFHNKTIHTLINRPDNNFDLRFVLGLLNSKLLNYFFQSFKEEEGRAFAQVKTVDIKNLPFLVVSKEVEVSLSSIVSQILFIKENSPTADTTTLESQIDQLVYELYGLTEEEIEIVEGSVNK